ncbi:cation-translocating P-type ATPase [Streptomyces sp. Tu 3180]|uniref:cation-translocating P-type ATPase n=1 Tax=Streptomyces sp. Tu 3180 TaxID=2682611 RepID=UPI001357E92D|nr:cation-translocating P-type ATPase [Streptomyces sp. Tu 3180]KAF3463693.1 HAD-IC family P-type ATPase [Streptomyces sp. Tu 3180]
MLIRFDVAPLAGAVAGAAAGAARSTAQGMTSVHDTTRRVRHVARNALSGDRHWRAGHRVHLALRHPDGAVGPLARKVAAELLDHPDVLTAYWDEGLSRLVVTAVTDAAGDRVTERAVALATRLGLSEDADPEEGEDEAAHPGDPREVRVAAAALLLDAAGAAGALTARSLRLPRSPKAVTAGVTLLRENPRFRALLRGRLGRSGMELVLAAANAAAHGAGQSPVSLALDGVLRTGQLTEAVARTAAFEALHDDICLERRTSIPCPTETRPPLRVTPAQAYAAHAGTGSVAGAVAALLVTHDTGEAAEAVLAGSPKAARYGPAAFNAALGTHLARSGVLVRSRERLRHLEIADSLVLHADALRSHAHGGAAPDGASVVFDDPVDPCAEAVLDAARRAGLHVVITGGSDLKDITRLADEVAPADLPFRDVVRALQNDGHIVVSVARVGADGNADVADGLPAADMAIALTDERSAVAWGADALAPNGLGDVWRLLTAIPAARQVGRRSQTLARAGAALSGLMVARGGTPGGRLWRRLTRHAPVNIAAVGALLAGVTAAARVATATPPEPRLHVPWHALEPHEARDLLSTPRTDAEPSGLALFADQAWQRAARLTRTPAAAPARWTWEAAGAVRRELDDPLTPVLATGAVASALLGSLVDALLVVGAMDLNAVAGGLQRLRAERALARLAARQQPKARRQDSHRNTVTVDAARLRPGDRISLGAGDVVPADARLLEADGLEVDESALTGESLPVTKALEPTPGAPVAQRTCMVFEGTTVVAGRAVALVVDTGDRTEAGRAVALAARTPPPAGVQARLQELTRKALPVTLTGGALVTGLSLLRGSPIRRAVSGGVAVAVAAVPEGLPLVATVAQMAAARRLSRRGVLVRTPRTLEALGRVDTVCFDKTGTLTENRLRLVKVATPDGTVLAPDTERAVTVVRLAARACPQEETGEGRRIAHATDEAVLDVAPPDDSWTADGELPFEASRGYAAAVGRDAADTGGLLVVKGAPETVLPACRDLPDHATETAHDLAGRGLRVLAVAHRPCRTADAAAELDAGLADLEFAGLVALADVPRDTSQALLAELRRSGILPVMLTGDHPETARAIAVQLGWPEDTEVVTGDELVAMGRRDRVRALHGAAVVARVAPEQKLHVVEALQQAGRVVAMAGDGANDAAAIRAADVGVGIEARGSAAARNAADIVLTTGDLSVLVDAVGEGRALWRSVADAVSILIGGNAGEVGFSVLGTLLAGSSPLSTRQLLLVNLLTDMFPAMAVAVTPSDDPSTAAHAETGPMGLDVLGAPLLRAIRRRGVTTCLGAVTAYLIGRLTPGTERRSTTMALCGVVGAQLVQTLSGRRHSPLVWVTALGSAAVLAALVQTPGVSHFFGCTPLGPLAWAGVALAIALSALAPRLERLEPVRHLYGAASRLALRLGDSARQTRHLMHSGIARPVA